MAKKFSLENYKKTIKVSDTPLKEDKYIVLDECLQSVLGLPGIPLGHITQIYGLSDTGKTSVLFHAAAQAQAQGILPILIITEGKVDYDRAATMGFDREQAIIQDELEFLEDVFDFIDKIASDVSMGELPQDVCIFWDSVGNTLSRDEVDVQKDGTWTKKSTMMKAAKVISERMRVMSRKINDTRKISYPKFVGLVISNQAYKQPPAFPGAPTAVVPYGGESIYYRSSFIIKTSRIKKLVAVYQNKKLGYGIISKIDVVKNHISNTTNSGEFVIVANAIIPNDKEAIDEYKKTNKDTWGQELEVEEQEV